MRLAKRRQPHRINSSNNNEDDDDTEKLLRHPEHPSVFFDRQQQQKGWRWSDKMARRTGITAFISLLVIFALASVNGQATEECVTRTTSVGLSIEETVEAEGETKTFLGLLAYFGGSVEANGAPMPIAVADDKLACKSISPVSEIGQLDLLTTLVLSRSR